MSAPVIATSVCVLLLLGIPAAAADIPHPSALPANDSLPVFELLDDEARPWKSTEHRDKVLVLYFYPGDFTSGCVTQAEEFRERLAELTRAGVEVIGVSGDRPETHQRFKDVFGLQHTLLADTDGDVARRLGIPVRPGGKVRLIGPDRQPILGPKNKSMFVERPVTLERWTFVIDSSGNIVSKRPGVNPAHDAAEVLEIVKKLP